MSDRRNDFEELGEIAELPPDDPRRRAFEAQPAARARLRAYEMFMSMRDIPEGARVAEAEAHLAKALEREIGVSIADAPSSEPRRHAPSHRRDGARAPRGLFDWAGSWGLRPVFAVAALAVLLVSVWVTAQKSRNRDEILMRSAPSVPAPGEWASRAAVEVLANGAVRLRWDAAAAADRYAAVFLSSDLSEIARVEGIADTHFDLQAGSLPSGLEPHTAVLWRIVAYQGTDELGQSTTSQVTTP